MSPHAVAPVAAAPVGHRPPAPAAAHRGHDHRRLLGGDPAAQPGRDHPALRPLAGAGRLGRELPGRGARHARPPTAWAGCSPTRRSTRRWRRCSGRAPALDAPELRSRVAEYTGLLAAAQSEDGYLNTYYGYQGGPERYSDLEWGHELYCAGHLLQAAVAAVRTGSAPELVDIARRLADHICDRFGADGQPAIDGHPEVETALVELYRVDRRAALPRAGPAVRRPPRAPHAGRHDVPRARLLPGQRPGPRRAGAGRPRRAGPVPDGRRDRRRRRDRGRRAAAPARQAQYDRTLERRTYLTGGMGSNHHGETYGDDFELPQRARVRRDLRGGRLGARRPGACCWPPATSGTGTSSSAPSTTPSSPRPSADGREFFYVNALQRRTPGIEPEPGGQSLRRTDGTRAAWFTTSCCPTNLARLVSTPRRLPRHASTTTASSCTSTRRARSTPRWAAATSGSTVATGYPYEGDVVVRVEGTPDDEWTLTLRVPAWAGTARLEVAGESREVVPGPVAVRRLWSAGDEVRLRWTSRRGSSCPTRGSTTCAARSRSSGARWSTRWSRRTSPDLDLELVAVDPSAAAAGLRPGGRPGRRRRRARARASGGPSARPGWPYGPSRVAGGRRSRRRARSTSRSSPTSAGRTAAARRCACGCPARTSRSRERAERSMSALKVLFVGGTGRISSACVRARGRAGPGRARPQPRRDDDPPAAGRRHGAARRHPRPRRRRAPSLRGHEWDAVVDWVAFTPDHVRADLDLFTGRTGQYVFISSASAYQTPPARLAARRVDAAAQPVLAVLAGTRSRARTCSSRRTARAASRRPSSGRRTPTTARWCRSTAAGRSSSGCGAARRSSSTATAPRCGR